MFEDFIDFLKEILIPIILTMIILSVLIITPVTVIFYYSSCKGADLYNKQNGTQYTCSDFFWAGEQINSQTQTIKLK